MSILSLVPPSGILCCCSWFPICAIAIANRHGASTGQCEREVHWLFIFGVVVLSAMVINLPLKWMNQGLRNNAGGDISFAQMSQAAKVCSARCWQGTRHCGSKCRWTLLPCPLLAHVCRVGVATRRCNPENQRTARAERQRLTSHTLELLPPRLPHPTLWRQAQCALM